MNKQSIVFTNLSVQAFGLLRMAARLDAAGLHGQADAITEVAERLAQSSDRDAVQQIPGFGLYNKIEQSGLAQGMGVTPLAEVSTFQSNDPNLPNAPMQYSVPPGVDPQTATALMQAHYWKQFNALNNAQQQLTYQDMLRWHGPQSWQAENAQPGQYQGPGQPAQMPVTPTSPAAPAPTQP